MKVYSLLCKNLKSIKAFIVNNQISAKGKYLIIVHTDCLSRNEIAPVTKELCKLLPCSHVIGCSVGGIIYKGESLTGKTLVSIIEPKNAEISCACVTLKNQNGYRSPDDVVNQLLKELGGADDGFLFTFYSPSYPFVSRLVAEFNGKAKRFKMIGGGAYSVTGDLCNDPAYIVHGDTTREDCIVVAKLVGGDLIANQSAITGIKSVGRTYKVTKSKEHRLIEVDGKPAKEWFNHIVGEEYLREDKNIIHALPLVRKDDDSIGLNIHYDYDALTKEPLGGDLFVFDEVKENDRLTAGYIDPNSSLSALTPLCKKVCESPTEGIFAYSCLTRRLILHNCAKRELNAFTSTTVAGAFLAGELIYDGACRYSNSAFTVATLSENPAATVNLNLHSPQNSSELQFDNLPLITYLFSTANSELKNEISESKRQLAKQMITDTETGLANVAKYVYDAKNDNFNALCLLSLKNENVIRVFLDKDAYHKYVITAANCCKKTMKKGVSVYRYGELSVLIAAKTDDKDAFVADIKRLKAELDEIQYDAYQPIYEMSIVFGEDDLLNKVELTYVNLHKGNKDLLVNTGEEDDNFKKEMNLLQVINDAISHDNVIPFYQGIRNNGTQKLDIYESLMRIADSNGNIYLPGEFLPVAKEYKLYDRLSQIMIAKVLDDAPKHDFSVTINLNTGDIYNHTTLNIIFDKLKKAERPEKIIFEIVESEAITDYDYLKTFTDKIHALGAKIAIDDFGSGYSNLMHVLRIDLDFIKITGDIVKDADTDPSCLEFINMITSWANTRNKKVVAEFVENEKIQRIVEDSKVAYSQGYLFSKPKQIS